MKKMKFMAAIAATVMSVTAVSTSFPILQASANDSDIKILCLGDSITDGYFGKDGYRKYLYHELDEMGYSIDMVGAKSGGGSYTTNSGESFTYDGDHSGYSGYSIENISGGHESRQGIRELVEGTWYSGGKNMIQAYDPDIVLLQIGTNDILSAYNDGIIDRLENLVNIILNDMNDPGDVLYIASIPYIDAYIRGDWLGGYGFNVWNSTSEEKDQLMEKVSSCVDSYNASIEDMVARMQSEGKSVAFGDINSVVNYQTDLEDGCHPNETGYEKMGVYWANLLEENYFNNSSIETKPVVTTATTTAITTTISEATTTIENTTQYTTTTTPAPETTTVSTTKKTVPVQPSGDDIVLENVSFDETYDLSAYKGMGINEVSFVLDSMPPYGMNGCAVFGNWELSKNYTADDLNDLSLNVELDKEYSSLTLHKWYGEASLSKIILKTANSSDENITTTTTAKPTTTTTTSTTTTAKPTTTTTTSTTTTAKPTTTTTTSTTTTAKPTTTTTTSTTTTAKPTTTTTTSTTTTAKPTTTKPSTTTITTSTTDKDDENTVVLKDVVLGEAYSLKDYDYKSISKIVIKWNGDVGYGFGGSLVLGSWTVQNSYGHNDMKKDGTIEFVIDNPQDKFTLFRYWGSVELESVTLYF